MLLIGVIVSVFTLSYEVCVLFNTVANMTLLAGICRNSVVLVMVKAVCMGLKTVTGDLNLQSSYSSRQSIKT